MDGGGLFSTKDIVVTVSSPASSASSAPYFATEPHNQSVKLNNTLVFSLPP